MNILILHHVETIWEPSLIKVGGIDFEELMYSIRDHIDNNDYDKIILTRFEGAELEPEHYLIADDVSEVQEYAYGWERESFEDCDHIEGVDFCEGGNHSEVVLLEQWQKDLKGHNVSLAGAFDGECIEDMEIALDFLQVEYKRIEDLII